MVPEQTILHDFLESGDIQPCTMEDGFRLMSLMKEKFGIDLKCIEICPSRTPWVIEMDNDEPTTASSGRSNISLFYDQTGETLIFDLNKSHIRSDSSGYATVVDGWDSSFSEGSRKASHWINGDRRDIYLHPSVPSVPDIVKSIQKVLREATWREIAKDVDLLRRKGDGFHVKSIYLKGLQVKDMLLDVSAGLSYTKSPKSLLGTLGVSEPVQTKSHFVSKSFPEYSTEVSLGPNPVALPPILFDTSRRLLPLPDIPRKQRPNKRRKLEDPAQAEAIYRPFKRLNLDESSLYKRVKKLRVEDPPNPYLSRQISFDNRESLGKRSSDFSPIREPRVMPKRQCLRGMVIQGDHFDNAQLVTPL